MATAVVVLLTDEGQMMVGEIDAESVMPDELQPVPTFEDAVSALQTLVLGEEPPPEVEEDAFNKSISTPADSGMGG